MRYPATGSRSLRPQSSFAGSAATAPSGPITMRSTLICAPTQHNGKADVARLLYRNARIADLVAKLQQLLPAIGDRRSRRHQHANMRRRARAERGEIVAALERR